MIAGKEKKTQRDRAIGGASCHSDQLVLAFNGLLVVQLALLVFLVLFPLGQQWLGVHARSPSEPNGRWAVGPTERMSNMR